MHGEWDLWLQFTQCRQDLNLDPGQVLTLDAVVRPLKIMLSGTSLSPFLRWKTETQRQRLCQGSCYHCLHHQQFPPKWNSMERKMVYPLWSQEEIWGLSSPSPLMWDSKSKIFGALIWTRKNAAKVMVAWLRANVPFPNPVRTPPRLSRVSGFPASRETGSCGQCRLGGDGAGSGWHTEALAATDLVQDSGLGARRAEIGSPWWQDLLHAVYKHISCHLGPVPMPGLHPGKPSRVTHTHTHCTLMRPRPECLGRNLRWSKRLIPRDDHPQASP